MRSHPAAFYFVEVAHGANDIEDALDPASLADVGAARRWIWSGQAEHVRHHSVTEIPTP